MTFYTPAPARRSLRTKNRFARSGHPSACERSSSVSRALWGTSRRTARSPGRDSPDDSGIL